MKQNINVYHLNLFQPEFIGSFLVQGRDVYVLVSLLTGSLLNAYSTQYVLLSSDSKTFWNLNNCVHNTCNKRENSCRSFSLSIDYPSVLITTSLLLCSTLSKIIFFIIWEIYACIFIFSYLIVHITLFSIGLSKCWEISIHQCFAE